MTIPFSMRVLRRPDVLVNVLGDESVILNLKSERYFGLDSVGTSMWSALTGLESIEEAYRSLLDEFDVDKNLLQKDLTALIERLVENELVELSAPVPGENVE